MAELLTTYKLDDLEQPIPMERAEFYDEQIHAFEEKGKPTRAAAVAQVFLFTPDKEFILQKRSMHKRHNPSLLDKSVGGHIQFHDSPDYTVMAETLQELEIPSFITRSEEDFKKTYRLLKEYVSRCAFIQFLDSRTCTFKKIFGNQTVEIANKYYFYLGVYRGAIKPADKEAAGILFYDYEMLYKEMETVPETFTEDIKFFLKKYDTEIQHFLKIIDET